MWQRRNSKEEYRRVSLTVLEGLEAVRKRPGMYIGSTGERGLHHLVWEVVDNAVDEALAGLLRHDRGDVCSPTVEFGSSTTAVAFPVDLHPKLKKPGVEVALTVLHAGGKFDGKAYAVSGGLHGVGVSVVNALSIQMDVEIHKDGFVWRQQYHNSKPAPLVKGEATRKTGSSVAFWPDPAIFETVDFNFETIYRRLQEMAFLNRGLTITLRDERSAGGRDGGTARGDLLLQGRHRRLRPAPQPDQDADPQVGGRVRGRGRGHVGRDRHAVERVVRRVGLHLRQHHQHPRGRHPRRGLPRRADQRGQPYGSDKKFLKGDEKLTGEDIREGLAAIVSVKLANPQFEGQTKTKLGNTDMKSFVLKVCNEWLVDWFERNPGEAKTIITKANAAARARMAAAQARKLARRKSLLESGLDARQAGRLPVDRSAGQ